MKRLWVAAAAVLGVLAVTAALAAFTAPFSSRNYDTSLGLSLQESLPRCIAMQTSELKANEEALACMQSALVAAVRSGTFGSDLDALAEPLAVSTVNQQCHAAGHRAGVELLDSMTFDQALNLMFAGKPHLPEPVCGTAVVHGLIQAFVSGDPPYDLEYLAAQCRSLERVSPGYATECAHYVGHATWKQVGALNEQLASTCRLLEGVAGAEGETDCIAGAVMQKYRLQDKGYIVDAPMLPAPSFDEVAKICDGLRDVRQVSFDGCWGGVGWLMSQYVESLIDSHQWSPDEPADRVAIVAGYVEALRRCQSAACAARVLAHMRIDFYRNGVAEEVCAAVPQGWQVTQVTAQHLCDRTLAVRRGNASGTAPSPAASATGQ